MSSFLPENESSRINYLETQLGLARREIGNLRQKLKSLSFLHQKECSRILELLENWRCEGCSHQQGVHNEETEGAVAKTTEVFEVKQIGVIDTNFPEKRGTPRQATICSDAVGKLTLSNDVFTNPNHSLEGLQEFSHMWILFYFHKNDSTHVKAKVSPPRLNGAKTGIFATRSPHRPSPIGLSLVKINRVVENSIYFSGVDMVDQTPVLDVKPYIPHYDNPVMINLLESRRNSDSQVPESESRESSNSPETIFEDLTYENLDGRAMDGEENPSDRMLGPHSPRQSSSSRRSDELYSRLTSRIGEREAPDGEEEDSADNGQAAAQANPTTSQSQVRVPTWIDHSPLSTLNVFFKEKALLQLNQLGVEGELKKGIIANVLREDPRSIYLRERWGGHCYVFRISELYVSCKFNDDNHTVTVYQVFQNADAENNDE